MDVNIQELLLLLREVMLQENTRQITLCNMGVLAFGFMFGDNRLLVRWQVCTLMTRTGQ